MASIAPIHCYVVDNRYAPSRLANDCDMVAVATEQVDVLSDPIQRESLIMQSCIGDTIGFDISRKPAKCARLREG